MTVEKSSPTEGYGERTVHMEVINITPGRVEEEEQWCMRIYLRGHTML